MLPPIMFSSNQPKPRTRARDFTRDRAGQLRRLLGRLNRPANIDG